MQNWKCIRINPASVLQGQPSSAGLSQNKFYVSGFEFRPRTPGNATGDWTSFLPAISASAMKRIRQTIRVWKLPRQTSQLERGWPGDSSPHQGWNELLRPLLQVRTVPALQSYRCEAGAVGAAQVPQLAGKADAGAAWLKRG